MHEKRKLKQNEIKESFEILFTFHVDGLGKETIRSKDGWIHERMNA